MINATLRVRCISPGALEAIMELLREESNAIYIETFQTEEAPRTGTKAPVIDGADRHSRAGSRANAGPVSRQFSAANRRR